ncbi:hypothetical protein N7491_006110 [Penicillium cf. griseofulvum]|nr:hypothetical protein N7491_006110 [Penicillium cf. griseofulvum]
MATTRIRTKQIIQALLPLFNVGTYKTTSPTLHNLEYVGTLSPWPNFKGSVQPMYNSQAFSRRSTAAAICQVLGATLEVHAVNLHFEDFKRSGLQYKNIPDIVGLSATVQGQGELRLAARMVNLSSIRATFGVLGFVSTYDETISPRQIQLASGRWHVEYSPVIYSTDVYDPLDSPSHGSGPSASMRQCMFYVATLASGQGPVNNQTPVAQWVLKS